ncbi:MAG: prepilin-type N-terminal cleavage/methylation domain-containing protein [Chlamydiales bacterium]
MRTNRQGYTLMEMVLVMVIMSTIGLVSSYAIVESMKTYALVAPSIDASYQARLASERLRRDIRELISTDTVSSMTATGLTFDDGTGTTIAYTFSGSDLLRNGDLLATGMSAFAFAYRKSDGTLASAAVELHLIEVDFTVRVAGKDHRLRTAVFPRALDS